MIKVSILKNGVFSFGATFATQEAADDYIGIESTKGSFGKKEREVKEIIITDAEGNESVQLENNEDMSKSISVREEIAIDGTVIRIHTLPAEYSTLITDITAQVLAKKESDEALQYLNQTDYLIIREMDNGIPCPTEIRQLRAEARLKVIK